MLYELVEVPYQGRGRGKGTRGGDEGEGRWMEKLNPPRIRRARKEDIPLVY